MKKILILTYMLFSAFMINAQETMYMMKGGAVVGQHLVTDVDSLTFYTPPPPPAVKVTGISLTPAAASTIYVGDVLDLSSYIVVSPSNATDKSATWSSSNSSIVLITNASAKSSNTNKINVGATAKALAPGTVELTATANDGSGVSKTMMITVSADAPNAYFAGIIPNAKYVGRWVKGTTFSGATVDRSFYTGAYIKVNFTGTTAKLSIPNGAQNVNFFVKIDGGNWAEYSSWGGELKNLTPTPLTNTEHTLLIVAGKSGTTTAQHYIYTDGLTLDSGAVTKAPTMNSKHIEFIGDSISTITYGDANPGLHWNWLIGEGLGWEHSHIAWPGGNIDGLTSGYSKVSVDFSQGASANWDFTTYTPDAVVVNLGQNGGASQAQYTTTFTMLRQRWPDAHIFGIGLFADTGSRNSSAINCENAITAMGDPKIHFLGQAEKTTSGDVHPNATQSANIASKLLPAIKTILGL